MSLSTINNLLKRIEVATPESQIAVFRTPAKITDRLDSIFSSTVFSQERIHDDKANLIGIYNKGHDINMLRELFTRMLRLPAV